MERATANGHAAFDFTIGDEGYKDQWCEIEIPLFDQVEPNNLVGWLGLGPRIAYLQAKRFIKQTPVLWQGFTRLRAAKGMFAAAVSARV
jgi:CelD/BcsL family acetyltransferase involved in cellulose biosynthesis